jgi:hypothetical protein
LTIWSSQSFLWNCRAILILQQIRRNNHSIIVRLFFLVSRIRNYNSSEELTSKTLQLENLALKTRKLDLFFQKIPNRMALMSIGTLMGTYNLNPLQFKTIKARLLYSLKTNRLYCLQANNYNNLKIKIHSLRQLKRN